MEGKVQEVYEAAVVDLRPCGPGKLRGLCPIHAEKTPSFFVFEDKARFRCFGCGEGGDVHDFLKLTRGLSFKESKAFLGMATPQLTAQERREAERRTKERAALAWRERELARTLGIAIRTCHEALRDCTPDTLDDLALVLQELPALEYHHRLLIDGSPEDKAAVVAEWNGVRLFKRELLFRRDFNYAAWLSGINRERRCQNQQGA